MRTVFLGQVLALTKASVKARYRGTFLGFLWVIFSPLLMFGVQGYAFSLVLNIQIENYLLFLMSGLFPWVFISQSLDMTVSSFSVSAPLLKSFPVHPITFVLSQILDNAFNFLAVFILVLIPLLLFYNQMAAHLWVLLLCAGSLFFGVSSLSWLLAFLNVFLRDVRYVVSFVLSIGYFLTPIFYHESFVPMRFQWILALNPLYFWIQPFQLVLGDFYWDTFLISLIRSLFTGLVFMGLGYYAWKLKKNAFYYHL